MIKDIPGYEGIYMVDDMGDVWSYKFGKVRKLRPGLDTSGYLKVNLSKDGILKSCLVHRLVTKAFLSDYSENLQVDHIDKNRINNKLSNLRMLTNQQNQYNTDAKGYSWHKVAAKWQAYIKKDYKQIHLGLFDKEEDARAAYLAAKALYHNI